MARALVVVQMYFEGGWYEFRFVIMGVLFVFTRKKGIGNGVASSFSRKVATLQRQAYVVPVMMYRWLSFGCLCGMAVKKLLGDRHAV